MEKDDKRCPRCRVRLHKVSSPKGFIFICDQCQGRAIALAVVRKILDPAVTRALWRKAVEGESLRGAKCPVCSEAMDEAGHQVGGQRVMIDLCRRCHFLWFDRDEMQQLPAAAQETKERGTSPEAREAMARFTIANMENGEKEDDDPVLGMLNWLGGL